MKQISEDIYFKPSVLDQFVPCAGKNVLSGPQELGLFQHLGSKKKNHTNNKQRYDTRCHMYVQCYVLNIFIPDKE